MQTLSRTNRCGRWLIAALSLATVAAPQAIFAQERERPPPFAGPALSAEELNELRGGFLGEGLRISLDIERLVAINGELVSSFSLAIPDLSQIAGRGVELQGSPTTLIQNGQGNTLSPSVLESLGAGGLLTVIQNSLDRQAIQGQTIINATISGAGSFGISETLSAVNLQTRAAAR